MVGVYSEGGEGQGVVGFKGGGSPGWGLGVKGMGL